MLKLETALDWQDGHTRPAGSLACYQLGDLKAPALDLALTLTEGQSGARMEAVTVGPALASWLAAWASPRRYDLILNRRHEPGRHAGAGGTAPDRYAWTELGHPLAVGPPPSCPGWW